MQERGNIVVGLDIGTTKICAVVGEATDNSINIIGIGTHPSIGLRKGVVVNIEATVKSIKKAVEEGKVSKIRYQNYLDILKVVKENKRWVNKQLLHHQYYH